MEGADPRLLPRTLTIDPGIRHCAVCGTDEDGGVNLWELWDLGACGVHGGGGCACPPPEMHVVISRAALKAHPLVGRYSTIAIETQMLSKYQHIQYALAAVFAVGTTVVHMHARHKLAAFHKTSTYAQRKAQAVGIVGGRVERLSELAKATWAAAGKRDDLADAYLMQEVAARVLTRSA